MYEHNRNMTTLCCLSVRHSYYLMLFILMLILWVDVWSDWVALPKLERRLVVEARHLGRGLAAPRLAWHSSAAGPEGRGGEQGLHPTDAR